MKLKKLELNFLVIVIAGLITPQTASFIFKFDKLYGLIASAFVLVPLAGIFINKWH